MRRKWEAIQHGMRDIGHVMDKVLTSNKANVTPEKTHTPPTTDR